MRKNKILCLALCTMVGASLMSGCSNEKKKEAEPVEISCVVQALPTAQQSMLQDMIGEYEKSHPGIKIDLQSVYGANYDQELMNRIKPGKEPDIFMVQDSMVSSLVKSGTLASLEESFSDKELGDFNKNFVELYRAQGKLYGIPIAGDALALYYNKDLFQKQGLKPPTNWAELKDTAQRLTKDDIVGIGLETDPYTLLAFIAQAGGKLSDGKKATLNSKECVKALDYVNSLYKEKTAGNYRSLSTNVVNAFFVQQRLGMLIGFSSYSTYVDSQAVKDTKWVVVPLPKGDREGGVFSSVGLAVGSHSEHKKEAMELVKLLTGKEAQALISSSSIALPVRKSMQQDYIKSHPDMEGFVTMMNVSSPISYGTDTENLMRALNQAGVGLAAGDYADAKAALDDAMKFYSALK